MDSPWTPKLTGMLLVALIAVLGVLAILMVMLVIAVWRRFNRRQTSVAPPQPYQDIWQIGGDRLIARMDQSPPQNSKDQNEESP